MEGDVTPRAYTPPLFQTFDMNLTMRAIGCQQEWIAFASELQCAQPRSAVKRAFATYDETAVPQDADRE